MGPPSISFRISLSRSPSLLAVDTVSGLFLPEPERRSKRGEVVGVTNSPSSVAVGLEMSIEEGRSDLEELEVVLVAGAAAVVAGEVGGLGFSAGGLGGGGAVGRTGRVEAILAGRFEDDPRDLECFRALGFSLVLGTVPVFRGDVSCSCLLGVTGGGGAARVGTGDVVDPVDGGGTGEPPARLLTGTNLVLMSTVDWRIGPEISKPLRVGFPPGPWKDDWLLLEGVGLDWRLSGVFSLLDSVTAEADLLTDAPPSLALNLVRPPTLSLASDGASASPVAIAPLMLPSSPSMWQRTASEESGFGSVDQVGVKTVVVVAFCIGGAATAC